MGVPNREPPCALFCAICYGKRGTAHEPRELIESKLGRTVMQLDPFPFSHTDYYEKEMGPSLKKTILVFEDPVPPGFLPEIKLLTNAVEKKLALNGKRVVNLDPGYLNAARVVLASTKDYSHRLYLSHGIYGEVTLRYHKGVYTPQPWTYPDYREEKVLNFLNEARDWYMERLKSLRGVA